MTNNTILPSDGSKYNICQVLKKDNDFAKYMEEVKQSRFSYIRPIDGTTRLMIYNSSNITGLDDHIHRVSKIFIEVADGYILVFTSKIFHAGVKVYERQSGGYLSHLRLFTYIDEKSYVSIRDEVSRMLNTNKCNINCFVCEVMPNENIHYERHIISYLDTQYNIDN